MFAMGPTNPSTTALVNGCHTAQRLGRGCFRVPIVVWVVPNRKGTARDSMASVDVDQPMSVNACSIPRDAQSARTQHICYLTLISGSALAVKASCYNLYASLIVFHFCHSFSISHMLLKVLKTLYLIFPSLFHQGTDSYCSKSHF